MQFRRTPTRSIEINIAPLIDVVFLLVIFFAVSTTFLESAGLKLELPSSSSTKRGESKTLVVLLDAEGQLAFEEEVLEPEALKERLREALSRTDNKVVVLRADTHAEHGRVVALMDIIREAGAEGLQVDAKAAPSR